MGSDGDDAFDPFGLQETTSDRPLLQSSNKKDAPFATASDFSFDPFALDDDDQESNLSPEPPPVVARISRAAATVGSHATHSTTNLLPPKLTVKLSIHQEASCTPSTSLTMGGACMVSIVGTVSAQVQCSDAKRNVPFVLQYHDTDDASNSKQSSSRCTMNPTFLLSSNNTPNNNNNNPNKHTILIPKHEIGLVEIANFTMANREIVHMPLLLERKVTIDASDNHTIKLAAQVRSKLSNLGHLHQFCICMAIPESMDITSISILKGGDDAVVDELKRTIVWKLPLLKKGESFVVSATARLWEKVSQDEQDDFAVSVPVLLRCESNTDPIVSSSGLDNTTTQHTQPLFSVQAADHIAPASVTYNTNYSFRLLSRLP